MPSVPNPAGRRRHARRRSALAPPCLWALLAASLAWAPPASAAVRRPVPLTPETQQLDVSEYLSYWKAVGLDHALANATAPDPVRDGDFATYGVPPGREKAGMRVTFYWNPFLWLEDRHGAVGAPGFLPSSDFNGAAAHANPTTFGKVPITQGARTPRGRLLSWIERQNHNPEPNSSYSNIVDYMTGER